MSSSRYAARSARMIAAESFLGRARRRAVVVGEVEMRDAQVEGMAHQRAASLKVIDIAEVMPKAQRDRGQLQAAAAAAVVAHRRVAGVAWLVGHRDRQHYSQRVSSGSRS